MIEKHRRAARSPRAPITRVLPQYWSDETTRRRFTDQLFDGTARDYDFAEGLLGFGSGPWYRRQALARCGLRAGMHVLDIATGTGLVAREALAIVGAEGRVVGLDPSAGMLAEAGRLPIARVQALGEKLPFPEGTFDFVSMGFALRHVADLEALFTEIRRVLKPGGTACILELTQPRSRLASVPLRLFMTRVVPFAARIARRPDAGRLITFYWDTIEACVRPEAVIGALARAGFEHPERHVSVGLFSEYVSRR